MPLDLVVLAAGIGRRFGGLKQIDPVGDHGELIIDYSLYDALRAGFKRVVFVIRPEMESDFRELAGRRYESRLDCVYVGQTLPDGLPSGRLKPLGTAHAVLSCTDIVRDPFAVINADDFYGADAFAQLAGFLKDQPPEGTDYAMVAYRLCHTLSRHGTVARGICEASSNGWLRRVVEQTAIEPAGDGVCCCGQDGRRMELDPAAPVSMNCWGFTPSLFAHLAGQYPAFVESLAREPDAEFFLPTVVDALLRDNVCRVRMLPSDAQWFGVTYPDDKQVVRKRLRALVAEGCYPASLWE